MISAVIKTNIDIPINYVSDVDGAMAGAMNFGWLGALIGGDIQKIETEIKSYFLIVTYIINEADKQLEHVAFREDDYEKGFQFSKEFQMNREHKGLIIEL